MSDRLKPQPSATDRHLSESWDLRRHCANAIDASFRWHDERGVVLYVLAIAMAFCLAAPTVAQEGPPLADQQLVDPAKEAEATALMETLRCIQCQGQSIADSDAPIAGAMRAEVRSRIERGENSGQIREWMIGRYGEWVSFEPRARGAGLLLWIAPFLILLLAFWLARGAFRGRRT